MEKKILIIMLLIAGLCFYGNIKIKEIKQTKEDNRIITYKIFNYHSSRNNS